MKKKIVALVLVFLLVFSIPAGAYQITGYELHSEAAMLISMDTGDILYSKNSTKKMYPASITNLMTAIVMVENISDLDNTYITYSRDSLNRILGTGLVVYELSVGEKIKARDALAGMLIASYSDIAYAVAEHVGGTTERFVEMMNEKAAAIGLSNTHFTNPIGLHDDELYSTAEDIYRLAKYAFEIDVIKETASRATYVMEATDVHASRTIANSNLMMNPNSSAYYKYTVCGKTGFTNEAGRCLVSMATYGGYTYMAIVLNAETVNGARNDFIDSANMYRWAFKNFEYKTVLENTTPVDEIAVNLSNDADFVQLTLEGGLEALLPIDADTSTIVIEPHPYSESIDAPVKKGTVLGTADIYYAEEKIGTINLVAAGDVAQSKFKTFVRDAQTVASNFFTSTLMKIVYGLIIAVIIAFVILTVWLNVNKKKRRKVKYKPIKKDELDDNEPTDL